MRISIPKINLSIICFLFTLVKCFAQQTTIEGTIIAPGDPEGIHIINLNTGYATITNEIGRFDIIASPGDSLKISSVEYENKTIRITQDNISGKKLEIRLRIAINQLDDVVVRPHNLTGNLGNDLKNINTESDVNAVSLGLPNAGIRIITQPERRLYTARNSLGTVPLELIINTISGRIKRLKKELRLEKKSAQTEQTKKRFESEFYTNHLKIPEHKIDAFIYFCSADPTFDELLVESQPLKMLEYFEEKSIEFNKLHQPENTGSSH